MSQPSMRSLMEKMKQVNEPGICDPKVIKEARSAQLTTLLSGEKNSTLNAIRAYAKMCEENGTPLPAKTDNKKILTEGENLKIVGAMTVIKEMLDSTTLNKKNALEVYKKVKEVFDSI